MATDTKPAKVNLFAKAKTKTADTPTASKGKRETVWCVLPSSGDPATVEQLDKSVGEIVRLQAEAKTIETQQKVHKKLVQEFANTQYIGCVSRTGVEPASPLKVSNSKGETVTFVVQDRGHLVKVTDEQVEALSQCIGADAVEKILYVGGEFKFSADVMAQNSLTGGTVQDVVADAITSAIAKLVEKKAISQDQADGLIDYKEERHFKPGTIERAGEICGKDAGRIETFLDLLSGGCVRYVKA